LLGGTREPTQGAGGKTKLLRGPEKKKGVRALDLRKGQGGSDNPKHVEGRKVKKRVPFFRPSSKKWKAFRYASFEGSGGGFVAAAAGGPRVGRGGSRGGGKKEGEKGKNGEVEGNRPSFLIPRGEKRASHGRPGLFVGRKNKKQKKKTKKKKQNGQKKQKKKTKKKKKKKTQNANRATPTTTVGQVQGGGGGVTQPRPPPVPRDGPGWKRASALQRPRYCPADRGAEGPNARARRPAPTRAPRGMRKVFFRTDKGGTR